MTPLLVIDAHYLCHRAYHSMGELSHNGAATGVIFGFLKTLLPLKEQFLTDRIAFCFEGKKLRRSDIYPAYKRRGRPDPKREDMESRAEFSQQIKLLRREYLPAIGFRNVFCVPGYESDDLMARLALQGARSEGGVVIVTADSDLYQCLSPNVSIYSPQKQVELTDGWFRKKYGIAPYQWPLVKALAGCHSDNVKGVGGIGETYALRYIKGELLSNAAPFRKIVSEHGQRTMELNRKLVQLPFKGTPELKLSEDEITVKGWSSVCKELGARSLAGQIPQLRRAVRHR